MVSVIVWTVGRAVSVMWLKQTASIPAVMVTADAEKEFVFAHRDGEEKVVKSVSNFQDTLLYVL